MEEALAAFHIHNAFAVACGDEPVLDLRVSPPTPECDPSGTAPNAVGDPLVRAIRDVFYDRFYARRPAAGPEALVPDPEFARRLASADNGRGGWEKGWVIQQIGPNGQVFVRKGDRERAAMPGNFVLETDADMAAGIGADVSLRVRSGTFKGQPGYYFAFGETLDELAGQLSLVRLYFHCDAEAAIQLFGDLSSSLNGFQIPFQLKAPAMPALYGRTDTVVLYIAVRYFPIAARIVAGLREQLQLAPTVPLFTRRLWPGIGAAVEPGTNESFGMHRSRLVAEGIADAWRAGAQDMSARLAAISDRFSAAGLNVARPWLGAGMTDPFDIPAPARLP
jgi:hypothetical protein